MDNIFPKRKRTRLKDYDYSAPGAYFVTICTHNRKQLFGKIKSEHMELNEIGRIACEQITNIEKHYSNVSIKTFVVMPNHVHMIIAITEIPGSEGINPFPTVTADIPNIVGKFKAAVTRSVGNAFMHSETTPLWQWSYHDHIIRGDEDYANIYEDINTNVQRWEKDCFYTENGDVKKSRPQKGDNNTNYR